MNRLYILLAALLANIALLSLASCSDDDKGGQPVIECVRTTDPELADSTFTDATVGQMILIQGQNLNDAKHVYINNQDVYFNGNYNTSTHIIVTIPGDLVVRGMDESLPLEIRVETSHGTATYAFHVIAGVPSLELYKADLPVNADGIPEMIPGQEVTLVGTLLHEIEHIYVTDLDTVPLFEVTEFTQNTDRTEIKLVMPANEIPDYGIYMVECYAGTAYCGFSKSPMEPEVYDVVPDMPIPGQKVVIYGKYLTNLTAVNLGGEIDIDINQVTENEAMSELTFIMPEQIPTSDSNGLISVTTLGGKATAPFYRYDWIFEDFDGNGTACNYDWGATYQSPYKDENLTPITPSTGKYLVLYGVTGWWDHLCYINGKKQVEAIDPSTPLDKIEVRYEVWFNNMWTNASRMGTKLKLFNQDVDTDIADYISGTALPGQWNTIVVSLSLFAPGAATYGDLCAMDNLSVDNFAIVLTHDNVGDDITVGYDNFRFYVKE